jgi:hypothetical protein
MRPYDQALMPIILPPTGIGIYTSGRSFSLEEKGGNMGNTTYDFILLTPFSATAPCVVLKHLLLVPYLLHNHMDVVHVDIARMQEVGQRMEQLPWSKYLSMQSPSRRVSRINLLLAVFEL